MIAFKHLLAGMILSAAALLAPAPSIAQALDQAARFDHISVVAGGRGAPVILIPGLATPRAVWDGIAPGLAAKHRVFLVQVNGFGGDAPGANLKPGILEGMVADLHRFIAANRLEGAAVVGHSMGGLVGLMLARQHPEDVGRLMVVDALPYVGAIFLPGATVAQIEPQAKQLRDAAAATYGKPADPAGAAATAAGMALKPASRARVADWVQAIDPRISAQAMYEDMTIDLRPDMASIAVPITLVYPWGGQVAKDRADAFYRAEYAKAPNVTYVDVGDSGHFVMLDQPGTFAAALAKFLGAD